MITIPVAISSFGLFLFLISLPAIALSFVFMPGSGFWLFATGFIVGAIGLFLIVFGILLKCASILFRK